MSDIIITEDAVVPFGTTWLGCYIFITAGNRLTVDGNIIHCVVSVEGSDCILDGMGEFSHNLVLVSEG